ncbi:ABC transporter permease [Gordonia sp. TBRC 11910]|uniref:ABC transporter permease n=1 Tax=Gordonia asplenii TaxID=2725283 RepID=A0A848KVT8_9ACTN|nr:ABC transporter permease [Gordonia asplenii]NMO00301.1 ABC transporter permease [Gordonia asplenii]
MITAATGVPAAVWLRTLIAVVVLSTVTVILLRAYDVRAPWKQVTALARGAAQLVALSMILSGVLTNGILVGAALAVMFSVAVVTATRRVGWSMPHLIATGTAMAAGAGTALTTVFASGALHLEGRYVLAAGGIVIGATMTVATLTSQHFTTDIATGWEEVEGWLSIGATARQATARFARKAVRQALIPSTDQTKTTGLVTLPGAFVGALFGGASPVEAGRFQIIVLASIMAAGALTAVVLVRQLSEVARRPVEETT